MKRLLGVVFLFFVNPLSADGLDDARASLNGVKTQALGQLGQVKTGLGSLSRDIGTVVNQMAAEKTASSAMQERIVAAQKELAAAEVSIASIKAMPEMIETPLKKSFEKSRELFDQLLKIAATRATLSDQIVADGNAVISRSQEAQKNIGGLTQLLNALIAQGERVLGSLIQIRDAFVRR